MSKSPKKISIHPVCLEEINTDVVGSSRKIVIRSPRLEFAQDETVQSGDGWKKYLTQMFASASETLFSKKCLKVLLIILLCLLILGGLGYFIYYLVAKTTNSNNLLSCSMCNRIISALQEIIVPNRFIRRYTTEEIKIIGIGVCSTLGYFNLDNIPCSSGNSLELCDNMCTGLVTQYIKIMQTNLYPSSNLPVYVCNKISSTCPLDIPCTIPKNLSPKLQVSISTMEPVMLNPNKYYGKILLITDPHLDLWYQNKTSTSCGSIICCEVSDGSGNSGYYADTSGTCEISIDFLRKIGPDFNKKFGPFDVIIMLGDSVAHDLSVQTIPHDISEIIAVNTFLQESFPGTPIITIPGNHDIYPVNYYSGGESDAWLYSLLLEFFQQNIINVLSFRQSQGLGFAPVDFPNPSEFDYVNDTIIAGGFYTVKLFDKLRLIMLNMNLYQSSDLATIGNCNDTTNQFAWFDNLLLKAQNNNETVIILGHEHYTDLLQPFSDAFVNIIKKYSTGNFINSYLFGHWHEYKMCFMKNNNTNIMMELSPYALSTFEN
jgi:predicted phosphodiesterase